MMQRATMMLTRWMLSRVHCHLLFCSRHAVAVLIIFTGMLILESGTLAFIFNNFVLTILTSL